MTQERALRKTRVGIFGIQFFVACFFLFYFCILGLQVQVALLHDGRIQFQ